MSLRQNLCKRLSAIGLRRNQVHSIVDQVSHWVKCSGQEWTVARLKDIKSYYVSELSGCPWKPTTWTSSKPNRLKGPFGSLRLGSQKQTLRTMNAVMAYSEFVSSEPTKAQLSKFMGSARSLSDGLTPTIIQEKLTKGNYGMPDKLPDSPRPPHLRLSYWELDTSMFTCVTGQNGAMSSMGYGSTIREKHRELNRDFDRSLMRTISPPKLFTEHSWSSVKRAPLLKGGSSPEDDMRWLADNLRSSTVRNDILFFKSLSVPAGFYQYARQVRDIEVSPLVGTIGFIQEPGFKLRAVANPFRPYQVMLDPLKRWALDKLRVKPRDCTFDQDRGKQWVSDCLKGGSTVHSVDLSDATNHFPLSFQIDYTSRLLDLDDKVTRESLHLFAKLSRSEWRLPNGSSLVFQRGQPLGLGPSFALFALSHHRVLEELLERGVPGDYRMLGDDVVIVGDELNSEYRKVLRETLLIPVSESKTLSSNKLGEFAGRLITSGYEIPTPKWRAVSDNSFLDVARLLGPQSFGLLRPRQRRVCKILAEVPEFLGGLGWNPKGIPLEERIAKGIQLGLWDDGMPEEGPFRSLSAAHISALNKLAYEHGLEWKQFHSPTHTPTRGVFSRSMALTGVREGFGPLELLEGDYRSGVPLLSDPRGQTTLAILEKIVAKATKLDNNLGLNDRDRLDEDPSMSM